MEFINCIKEKAKQNIKTVILPEATDKRILEATEIVLKEGFAKIVLVGNEQKIKEVAGNLDISAATIIDPLTSDKAEEYANALYELRKAKGLTLEKAKNLVKDEVYYGMMMVKQGDADGLVSGAIHSTADTLRPALQILKTAPDTKLVSTFFVMTLDDCEYCEHGAYVFSDSALVENPTAEQLSDIAIAASKSFKNLIEEEPKVAMLSYSSFGSAKSELTQKVIEATKLAKEKDPNLMVDGEMQLDTAIVPEVAKLKAPDSLVAGSANVLIFPDLNSGNIGYKLVQRFGKAKAYGPITQGIAKPVNDLSRGCVAEDIVGVVAITCVQ